MNESDAREALRTLDGFEPPREAAIREIPGGWSSHTFAVEPDWIFRFPRSEAVARGHAKERRLLPLVAEHVSFAVPRFDHVGEWRGLEFLGHRRVPGRPLEAEDADPEALASLLAELHAVPVSDATSALAGPDSRAASWRTYYEDLERDVEARALPLLDSALADRVRAGMRDYLESAMPDDDALCLVHADLGAVHILVDERTGRPTGLIDFEDAAIGDPAIDLVGIRITAGPAVARAVCRAHPCMNDAALARLDFFTWMAPIHAVLYGLDEQLPDEVRAGIAGLTERIDWNARTD